MNDDIAFIVSGNVPRTVYCIILVFIARSDTGIPFSAHSPSLLMGDYVLMLGFGFTPRPKVLPYDLQKFLQEISPE